MQKFKDALREEQKRLEEIIAKAKKENEHMPEGNLRISKHKNRCRYYHCVHDRNGIYIPKRNLILREQLAQKAYKQDAITRLQASSSAPKRKTRYNCLLGIIFRIWKIQVEDAFVHS